MGAFVSCFAVFAWLSFQAISHLPLFGDEAFYWLESRFLDWSYTDLPGFTAWQAALAEKLAGQGYSGLRWLSWLAGLSLPWLGFWLAWQFGDCIRVRALARSGKDKALFTAVCSRTEMAALAGLLIMALPLLRVIGVLVLPDVWLLFFSLLISTLFLQAIRTGQRGWWVALAVCVAVAVNVHVRLWIWLFFAALALLLVWPRWSVWRRLLRWVLPAAILGLLPVLYFNFRHDWALFAFQFGQRHPWRWQPENLSLILAQILLVSPFLFWLWGWSLKSLWRWKTASPAPENRPALPGAQRSPPAPGAGLTDRCVPLGRWIAATAGLHWLFYAITGLFADGLRTTVHWMLASYLPVLALVPVWWCQRLAASQSSKPRGVWLLPLAAVSGLALSLALALWLAQPEPAHDSRLARVLDNSSGWPEMARNVRKIAATEGIDRFLADVFMTGAELGFELDRTDIRVLPHDKNIKHGRQAQLRLMGLLHDPTEAVRQPTLLVVEDSTLKLQNKGRYYLDLCQMPGSLRWLGDLLAAGGNKKFILFRLDPPDGKSSATAHCQLPALFYAQHRVTPDGLRVTGWVVRHHANANGPSGQKPAATRRLGLRFQTANGQWQQKPVHRQDIPNPGVARLFPALTDPALPQVGFEVQLPAGVRAYQLVWQELQTNGQWQKHRSKTFLVD